MKRLVRDHRLETRTARLKLKGRHEPYWREIYRGTALGYRTNKTAKAGRWILRQFEAGRYRKKTIGYADDIEAANGKTILDYRQAQAEAMKFRAEDHGVGYTVRDAYRDYLADYQVRSGKDTANLKSTFAKHINPALGSLQVNELTPGRLRRWLNKVAGEATREKKATANKILTRLKAALNLAFREGRVPEDRAWRIVRPFKNVDAPRIRILTPPEIRKLIDHTDDEFRPMVKAALMTGCRYGELCRLQVRDFSEGYIHVAESKSGEDRDVPLSEEGGRFFSDMASDRGGEELLFLRDDRMPWQKNHQTRRMRDASAAASINPPVTFHILRHAYGGALAKAGVSLQIIAAALGHADTRITEKHYAHLAPSHVADVIRANLPPIDEGE